MGVEITSTGATTNWARYTITLPANNGGYHVISTVVTSHPCVVESWLTKLVIQNRTPRHRLVIGLGVQWTPFYYHNRNHAAATIQLCIGKQCLIFHLTHTNYCPSILRNILSDPSITFVGLWNSQDSTKLVQSRHQLRLVKGMPIDLRYHVADNCGWVMSRSSIELIGEEFLGIDIEWNEDVSTSNWDVYNLSLGQIQQAAVKAFVAFAIGVRISAWNLNTSTVQARRVFDLFHKDY